MQINEFDRVTLILILDELELINDPALNGIKNHLEQIVNPNNNFEIALRNSLDTISLYDFVHSKIREPLYKIYSLKSRPLNCSSWHTHVFNALMALSQCWPIHPVRLAENHPAWIPPFGLCTLTNRVADNPDMVMLASGHHYNKKRYCETRAELNNTMILTHPELPGLLLPQEREYNFDGNYSYKHLNVYANYKAKLLKEHPRFNFLNFFDLLKHSYGALMGGMGYLIITEFIFPTLAIVSPLIIIPVILVSSFTLGLISGFVSNYFIEKNIEKKFNEDIAPAEVTRKAINLATQQNSKAFLKKILTARETKSQEPIPNQPSNEFLLAAALSATFRIMQMLAAQSARAGQNNNIQIPAAPQPLNNAEPLDANHNNQNHPHEPVDGEEPGHAEGVPYRQAFR